MKNEYYFKHGKEYIDSMEVLIGRYKESIKLGISKRQYEQENSMKCLLCNPIGINRGIFIRCITMGCPWVVISGQTCPSNVYETTDVKIMKNRIKQLHNWIKIYKKHMEKIQNEK